VGDPPASFIGVSAGLRFESLEPRRFSKLERYGFGSRRQNPNARREESSDEPFSTVKSGRVVYDDNRTNSWLF
jgi:hypothetical protein